eukprot:2203980-Heterocapsa_arctica.AAC.1
MKLPPCLRKPLFKGRGVALCLVTLSRRSQDFDVQNFGPNLSTSYFDQEPYARRIRGVELTL